MFRYIRTETRNPVLERFLYPYLIETLITFVLLSCAYAIEFNSRGVLNKASLDSLLRASAQVSIISVFIVRLTKVTVFTAFTFLRLYVQGAKEKTASKLDFQTILTDAFISMAIVLTTIPIRPIVQDVNFVGNEFVFHNVFAKFYSRPSMLVLSVLGIPLIILMYKKMEGIYRNVYIFLIIATIGLVGYLNSRPNFQGRIYDSRANWVRKDWEKTSEEAGKALEDAETDHEKCTAYYWLGIAANLQKDYEKGIDYQLKAINLCPNYVSPYSSISTAYTNLGNYYQAKINFEKCLELDPKYAWCYYSAAAYYDYTGDKQKAFESVKKAYELAPESEDLKKAYEQFVDHYPHFK